MIIDNDNAFIAEPTYTILKCMYYKELPKFIYKYHKVYIVQK